MSRRPALVSLAVLVLCASLALRLAGIGWLLPSLVEPDAHLATQVRLMEGTLASEKHALDWGAYPHLVSRLTCLLTPREDWSPPATELGLPALLERARWPITRVRLVVALLSLLALPATYALARTWLSSAWSLLAASLMGTSLLASHFAAQARPHGAAVGLIALAVLAAVRLRRRGDLRSYALAGIAAAAAIGCLQSGLATLIPLVVAHAGVVRERGRSRHALLLLPLAVVATALVALAPFVFAPSSGADAGRLGMQSGLLMQAKHRIVLTHFNGEGFLNLGRALWDWEPTLLLGALLAASLWTWGRLRARAAALGATSAASALPAAPPGARGVVLSFVLSYAVVVGLYEHTFERFLLPLVPFLAVFAAWGAAAACTLARSVRRRRALGAALVLALLALPVTVGVQLVRTRLAPSTVDLAAQWIEEYVASTSEPVLLGRTLDVPLVRSLESRAADADEYMDQQLGWLGYQTLALGDRRPAPAWNLQWIPMTSMADLRETIARDPEAWVDSLPAEVCLIDARARDRTIGPWERMTAALREHGELLVRISPDGGSSGWDQPLAYQDRQDRDAAPMAWRLLHAQRFGPVVEIYRHALPSAAGR